MLRRVFVVSVVLGAVALGACSGEAGPAGERGPAGPPGAGATITDAGASAVGEVTTRASFTGEEDLDNGVLTKRTLRFSKAAEDTQVRILYFDSLSARGGFDAGACSCRWELLVDNKACSPPLFGDVGSVVNQNVQPTTMVGLTAASAGDHTITVRVGPGVGSGCDCFTGLASARGLLEATEIAVAP